MKVVIDVRRCAGFAICVGILPEVFQINDEECVAFVLDDHPPETFRPQLEEAVHRCPVGAITLED